MRVGYLYFKEEKEVKKDIENGLEVVVGIDASNLLDTINVYEVNNPGQSENVIALVKKDLLVILQKVEQEVKENDKKN